MPVILGVKVKNQRSFQKKIKKLLTCLRLSYILSDEATQIGEGMKRRGAGRYCFCSLRTRKDYVERLLYV
jgi:hypothetical protein